MKRTLIFPRERVLAVCPRLADLKALPPLNRNGAARAARPLPQRARRSSCPSSTRPRAAPPPTPRSSCCARRSSPACRRAATARRAALRAEVRRYVRAHLQDPALDPEAIARAHAISVRALHALFEDTGESVAGLVRRERLARCFEDLGLPSGGSVTEIAFRWGFRDAAHFSRVFKREFERHAERGPPRRARGRPAGARSATDPALHTSRRRRCTSVAAAWRV